MADKQGGQKSVRPNSSGKPLDYPTMSLQEISNLHKQIFNNNTLEKHNVFMWTIEKYLYDTETFMNKLGYTMHARIVWDKLTGQAAAFTLRYTHEYLV